MLYIMSLLSEVETIKFHAPLNDLAVIERSRNDNLQLTNYNSRFFTHDSRFTFFNSQLTT